MRRRKKKLFLDKFPDLAASAALLFLGGSCEEGPDILLRQFAGLNDEPAGGPHPQLASRDGGTQHHRYGMRLSLWRGAWESGGA